MSTSSEGICQKHKIPFGLCDCGPHAWLQSVGRTFDEKEEEIFEVPDPTLGLNWEGNAATAKVDGGRVWRAELKPVGFIFNVFARDSRSSAGQVRYGFEVMDADCTTLRMHTSTSAFTLDEAFLAAEKAAVELLLEALAVFPCEEPHGFGVIEIDERYQPGGPLGSFKASPADAIALVRVILRNALAKKRVILRNALANK